MRENIGIFRGWCKGGESGLLECMSKAVDKSGEPKGSMTADEILEVIDGLKV